MICPKCSREMGSDKNVCDFCGFTFQTPKNNDNSHTAPYSKTPFTGSVSGSGFPARAASGAYTGGQTTVQAPPPPPPPVYQNPNLFYAVRQQDEPLSVGQYLGMILLSLIPVAGLIVLIVWAASHSTNANRRHFAGAVLILKALGLIFALGACIVFFIYNTPLFFYIFR